jgi:lipopolysaccharide export LptBFGC system permease protein LptF
MAFNYNHLEDVDTSQNSEILKKFNDILEKNNLNDNFKKKLETINLQFKEDRSPRDDLVNKIRWNTYYYKKYRQQTRILLFISFICVLMIVLSKLRFSYFEKVYSLVVGIILGLAFIYTLYGIWDLLIKDDKNFDEYNFAIYGRPSKNITELNPVESNPEKKTCKPITPDSVNDSFLNKYF